MNFVVGDILTKCSGVGAGCLCEEGAHFAREWLCDLVLVDEVLCPDHPSMDMVVA